MREGNQNNDQSYTARLGNSMVVIAWILVLGLLTFFFSRFLQQQYNPNQQVISSQQDNVREIVLQRNRYGHYVATGKINSHPAEFMLDTGASMVSVPEQLAQELRLQRGPVMHVNTANGTIPVYATILDRVQLGNIVLHSVQASINPYMQEQEVLLGMSFLKHLEFIQQNDQLTLRQYQ